MGNTDGMNLYRFGPDVLVVAESIGHAMDMLDSRFLDSTDIEGGCYTLERLILDRYGVSVTPAHAIRMLLPGEDVILPLGSLRTDENVSDVVFDADPTAHADLHTTAKAAIALLGPGVTDLSA